MFGYTQYIFFCITWDRTSARKKGALDEFFTFSQFNDVSRSGLKNIVSIKTVCKNTNTAIVYLTKLRCSMRKLSQDILK